MKLGMRIVLRALTLLAVWLGAAYAVYCSAHRYSERSRLAAEVSHLDHSYDHRVSDFADVLVEGKKISGDPDYQVQLLKQRFGYARPNETPIVIQIEDGK